MVLRIENILTMYDDMAVIFDENDEQCEVGLDDKNFTRKCEKPTPSGVGWIAQ